MSEYPPGVICPCCGCAIEAYPCEFCQANAPGGPAGHDGQPGCRRCEREQAPEICSACYYGRHDLCMQEDHPAIAKCQCNRYTCALRRANRGGDRDG